MFAVEDHQLTYLLYGYGSLCPYDHTWFKNYSKYVMFPIQFRSISFLSWTWYLKTINTDKLKDQNKNRSYNLIKKSDLFKF